MRLQGVAIWEILTFLLNAMLFLLVGLQLPSVLDRLSGHTGGELVGLGAPDQRGGDRRAAPVDVPGPVRRDHGRPAGEDDGPRRAPPAERLAARAGRACADRCRSPPRSPSRSRSTPGGPLPGPRADHLPDVRGDPRDARRPGAHARPADHRRFGCRRRRNRGARGADRPPAAWPRPASTGSTSWASPTGSAPTASSAPANLLDYRRRRFGALVDGDGERLRGARRCLAAADVRALRRPARGSSSTCATAARSATRSGARSSATSISRSPGSRTRRRRSYSRAAASRLR